MNRLNFKILAASDFPVSLIMFFQISYDERYFNGKIVCILTGRHVEEQFDSERAGLGKRRRCVRGSDGRDGHRLCDSGMRVRLEKPEGRH